MSEREKVKEKRKRKNEKERGKGSKNIEEVGDERTWPWNRRRRGRETGVRARDYCRFPD